MVTGIRTKIPPTSTAARVRFLRICLLPYGSFAQIDWRPLMIQSFRGLGYPQNQIRTEASELVGFALAKGRTSGASRSLAPSPPTEQAAARQDQSGQSR